MGAVLTTADQTWINDQLSEALSLAIVQYDTRTLAIVLAMVKQLREIVAKGNGHNVRAGMEVFHAAVKAIEAQS